MSHRGAAHPPDDLHGSLEKSEALASRFWLCISFFLYIYLMQIMGLDLSPGQFRL